MRFFTSDTHFGHARILELSDRPFETIEEHDWTLVKNWNAVVRPEDEVYHLGDVALGPKDRWQNIFNSLNGIIHLAIGNHDAPFAGNKPKYREKYSHLYERFDSIQDEIDIVVDDMLVRLSHFPAQGDSHDKDRYDEFRPKAEGIPIIHGHQHKAGDQEMFVESTPHLHVGVDGWNYVPVAEDHIVSWLRQVAPVL